jgi:hypothetical protein
MCTKKGFDCTRKKDRGPGCFPCSHAKIKCSLVAATVGAPGRAAGDTRGTVLGLQDDFNIWTTKWDIAMIQRAQIDKEFIKIFLLVVMVVLRVEGPVHDMWTKLQKYGYAEVLEGAEDHREGISTGVEKWRKERSQAVAEGSEEEIDMEGIEEDRDGSEVDKIEEEEVTEVQGKGKGKEKAMEEGAEESTLA